MAIDEGLRSRLEALNRGPVPEPACTVRQAVSAAVRAAGSRRPLAPPGVQPGPPTQPGPAWRSGLVRPIAGLVRRGNCVTTDAGEHWCVRLPLDAIWPGGEDLVARRRVLLADRPPAPHHGAETAAEPQPAEWPADFPGGVIFVDLETCGFSGSALFLAGLLREIDGRLAVELLLARDYSEEAAVLASLWRRLDDCTSIVTFNGKSFDWPMVVDRTRRHRLLAGRPASSQHNAVEAACPPLNRREAPRPPTPRSMPPHIDLLHLARRRWRREVPNCKLQTLERHICGRIRSEDLPSSQIPAAYQQYVRTGFEREMDAILLHNAVDLVTMLDLAMRLQGAA